MTQPMKELFAQEIDTYKELRNEVSADTQLNDKEKDWILTNIQQTITHQHLLFELELA
jgi:hypothetical protein